MSYFSILHYNYFAMLLQALHICNLNFYPAMWLCYNFLNRLLYSIFSLIPIVRYYMLNARIVFRYKAVCFFLLYLGVCVFVYMFVVISTR